jgi:hypothetical protein
VYKQGPGFTSDFEHLGAIVAPEVAASFDDDLACDEMVA